MFIVCVFVFPSVARKAILNLLLNCSSSVKYHWLNSQRLSHTTLCTNLSKLNLVIFESLASAPTLF